MQIHHDLSKTEKQYKTESKGFCTRHNANKTMLKSSG